MNIYTERQQYLGYSFKVLGQCCIYGCSRVVNLVAMDASVSVTVAIYAPSMDVPESSDTSQPYSYGCSGVSDTALTLQLWMLQCQWHSINPTAMDAPVSVTQHQPYSYGCSSVTDKVNLAVMVVPMSVTQVNHTAMDAPLSLTISTLQLWMLHYHWQYQPYSCGCFSAIDTGASTAAGLINKVTWWPLLELLSRYPLIPVKSLQLTWRSGTHRWNVRVPNLQMSCIDLTNRKYKDYVYGRC